MGWLDEEVHRVWALDKLNAAQLKTAKVDNENQGNGTGNRRRKNQKGGSDEKADRFLKGR